MIDWKYACPSDKKLLYAIARLFCNRTELLDFFFHSTQSKLSASPEKIREMSRAFCSGDEFLIRLALDIWSQDGGINFNEIYQKVDDNNFYNIIATLGYLRGDQDIYLYGQLKLANKDGSYGHLNLPIF